MPIPIGGSRIASAYSSIPFAGNTPLLVQHTDVVYDDGSDPLRKLDVYAPSNGTRPTILFMHGGGLAAGDKSKLGPNATYFYDLGYTFVSMNYRLYPPNKFADQWYDLALAIAFLYNNAATYGIDHNKIFPCGHSAGAITVSGVMNDVTYLAAYGFSLSLCPCWVCLDGVYNLDYTYVYNLEPTRAAAIKAIISDDPAVQANASAINHVSASTQPCFLSKGHWWGPGLTNANALMPATTDDMGTALTAASITHTIFDATTENHVTVARDLYIPNPTSTALQSFLAGYT
jgi:hypothetical protein